MVGITDKSTYHTSGTGVRDAEVSSRSLVKKFRDARKRSKSEGTLPEEDRAPTDSDAHSEDSGRVSSPKDTGNVDKKKKKKRDFFGRRSNKYERSSSVRKEKQNVSQEAESSSSDLSEYLHEIGTSPSKLEEERLKRSYMKGTFCTELCFFPVSLFNDIHEEVPPEDMDGSSLFSLGLLLVFPKFVASFVKKDLQQAQSVSRDIGSELTREEDAATRSETKAHVFKQ